MPTCSEYSVFVVLFPMLTEFHCDNLSLFKSMSKINIILDILDTYIFDTEDPQVGLFLIFLQYFFLQIPFPLSFGILHIRRLRRGLYIGFM